MKKSSLIRYFRRCFTIAGVQEEMDHNRFYKNTYSESSVDNTSKYLKGKQLSDDLLRKIKVLDDTLFNKINNLMNKINPKEDSTVYTGYSGIALLYLLKYKKTENRSFLFKAKELIEMAISRLRNQDISFLLGDAGPLALGAVIYSKLQDSEGSNNAIRRLIELPQRLNPSSQLPYEILYGHAGYLYALLFVKKELGSVIPDDIIKETIQIILQNGHQKAKKEKFPAPLFYEWYDTNYLGAAHGVSGILYMLLCANEYLTQNERNELIRPTIDWLAKERFISGNFKSSAGRDRDALVHWCHGSPGAVYLYLLASKVFNSDEYMDLALQCGDVVWHRGLLKKGYSICHGVSGNAYTFIQLYQATDNIVHLYRAACFADWCAETYPQCEGHKPDSPYSMFEGIAGLDYFLTDIQDPSTASFPAYALA